ncbi:MAG: DUF3108 domain-containing protein [Sulfuricellaceae bacterium]|nr:DUF3108 domain-containing protein [Sulfuricellaceae bacterium]
MIPTGLRFTSSIGISLLLHAWLFLGPAFEQAQPAPEAILEARLIQSRPAPQPSQNRPLKKSGKPVIRPVPPEAFPQQEPVQENPSMAEPETLAEITPEQALVPLGPLAVAGTPLPEQVDIQYEIFKGTTGLKVGQAEHRWQREGMKYTIQQTSEASGLVSFFYSGRHMQHSQGEITPTGLQPTSYRVERGQATGKVDNADFDWADRQLHFSSEQRSVALPTGAQDLLSFLYQLALFPPEEGKPTFMAITNGRKLGRYGYEMTGEVTLELPLGSIKTLRIAKLRQEGEENTEIWLATEYHYLPVKIRQTDKQGGVVEQVAAVIKIP